MNDLWNSINWGDAPTWVTGILTACAVLVASLQVRQAAQQNKQSAAQEVLAARQLEDSYRPIIIATLEPSAHAMQMIEFRIKNVGQGPAYDVTFEFTKLPEISELYGKSLFWEVDYLENGIPVMGPGEARTNLADMYGARSQEMDNEGRVKISYRSVNQKEYFDEFAFSFQSVQGLRQSRPKNMDDVVRALDKMSGKLDNRT